MKKGFRTILGYFAFLALVVSMTGCGHEVWPDPESSSVLFYMEANNSLSIYSYDFIDQIAQGYLPERNTGKCEVLVYLHRPNSCPQLMKLTRRANGTGLDTLVLKVYDMATNSSSTKTLHQVILDAEAVAPAAHHGLVMWSHATGYLPEGYFINPRESHKSERKTFGSDYNFTEEMDIMEMAEALPFHYDFILFDCCLMGGIEVAYELRDKCDYIVFSPAEVMAKGFPYYVMLEAIWNGEGIEQALRAVCEEFYSYYSVRDGGTVTLVKTEKLEALANACRTVFTNHRDEIFSLSFNSIQRYFRYNYHWYFDLGDIVEHVATLEEMAAFQQALDDVVVYKAATEYFLLYQGGFYINKYSGLSSYLPRPEYYYLNNYYYPLAWNQATGLIE